MFFLNVNLVLLLWKGKNKLLSYTKCQSILTKLSQREGNVFRVYACTYVYLFGTLCNLNGFMDFDIWGVVRFVLIVGV